MGRDDLKSRAEDGGYVEYGKEQLPKIESMRRDKSQPDFYGIPILHDQDVMFTTASEMDDKPASCYTCQFQQSDFTCGILGPDIKVSKVTGSQDSGDPIEYWPCCGEHDYGPTQNGSPSYRPQLSTPDQIGLIWINASEVGQAFGGANCGGGNGGDDCDHYLTNGPIEKWNAPQGQCRVLQHTVDNGDVCTAWRDDDILNWQDAQQLMEGESVDNVKKRKLVKSIVERDDNEDE